MAGKDSIDVTLAHVDPSIVSCWDKMVKRGEECSLLLKHSKGKVIATLQCTTPVKTKTSSNFSTPSAEEEKKNKKKRKRGKKRKLEKLLAYHQRLVAEKGLPPSRLMEEHAALSLSPSHKITCEKQFKCDQCDFASDSQRGLRVHVGRSHKETEVLRAEEQDVSFALSEVSEVREEDSSVKADTSFGLEEQEAAEPAHPHPDWVMCPITLCRGMRERLQNEIKAKRPCNHCDAKHQDDCDCDELCEDCNDGECCNNCQCCGDWYDYLNGDVTSSEWKAYFASLGMDLPVNFLETYVPPFK